MADKVIQLYSIDTPNGHKIAIFLEESGLSYQTHIIDIRKGEQFGEEFLKISPNNKIPAIVDPNGPEGKPITLFESGAILLYLAEKTGKFLPKDPKAKHEVVQWLFWQVAGLGPMLGQLGHFYHFAPEKIEYSITRYHKEAERLFKVLNTQLEGHDWVVGNEFSIADIAIAPWLNSFVVGLKYEALPLSNYPNVDAYLKRFLERPAVQKGLVATPWPALEPKTTQ
jgi:GST-like protein